MQMYNNRFSVTNLSKKCVVTLETSEINNEIQGD